jgi:hypothetical protein
MRFVINGEEHNTACGTEAEALVASCRQIGDLEIWASDVNKASLCAVLNAQCGWLMFLRFPEDTGFSSRNPMEKQNGSDDEMFLLSNGQADNYPSAWTFDRAVIFDALLEFINSGSKPSIVAWHDDALN